jgi:hypothetical protein
MVKEYCGTADSLMVKKYDWYSREINARTTNKIQQTFQLSHNMGGTADRVMPTQYEVKQRVKCLQNMRGRTGS